MENRDRDKISKSTGSTSAGDVNRKTSSNIGQKKSDSSAEFGQKVGRSENIEREPSRKSGLGDSSGMHSDSGRDSGSSGFDSNSDRSKSSDYDQGESGVRYRGGNRGGSTSEDL